MLLGLMRKHAQSWLIKALMVIIAAVFVLYFGTMHDKKRKTKAAVVNGVTITINEFENAYRTRLRALRNQYRDLWNDDLIKDLNIEEMTLNSLIDQVLIDQEAERLGFGVTAAEIRQAIRNLEVFKINHSFDMGRYKALLNQQNMTTESFEHSFGKDLLFGKLSQFLSAFSVVTDQEILDQYTYNTEEIQVSYIQVSPDEFRGSVTPDPVGMKDFFEEHKENYRVPEKIKIAYIEIDPKVFEPDIHISEEDIRSYYEYNIEQYEEAKKVRARHILLKLEENAPEDQVKTVMEKAEFVLKQAREGQDFAELAKKYSEGPTGSKGGDLGYFSEDQMVKPFEDAAFKLKAGEVSDLVRTRFGFHIIKVEDVKEEGIKSLEQVRESIIKTMKANAEEEMAYEKGQTLIDQMPYDMDLEKYVTEQDMPTRYTDYLSKDQRIPGIGAEKKLMQTLFSLGEKETSELIEIKGKYYIFQVAARKASFIPEMDAVESQVEKNYVDFLAGKQAKATADGILTELREGKAWDTFLENEGYKIVKTDFFNRRGSIPQIDFDPDLMTTLFKLNENERYPDSVFENKGGSYIFKWEKYKGIEEEKYQKERENLRYSMMRQKGMRLFENWLEALRGRADIEKIIKP